MDRNILNEEIQITVRLKQYFEEFLFTDEIIGTENRERNEQLIKSEIHTDDLVDAIRAMKKVKVADHDQITGEMLKEKTVYEQVWQVKRGPTD